MTEFEQFRTDDPERRLRQEFARIFTPAVPITDPKLFSGRTALLRDLGNQLDILGRVVVLYGDRGVGKTSFCNILLHGRRSHSYSCTPYDSFVTIFLNILRDLDLHLTDAEKSRTLEMGLETGADGVFKVSGKESGKTTFKPIGVEELDQAGVFRRLREASRRVDTIVFDEAQNLRDRQTQYQLSSLLKMFSDHRLDINVIFVGIGESDEDLLPPDPAYAEYKLRHYTTARIPLMSEAELHDIIERRQRLFKIFIDTQTKSDLARISSGYPSIAHSLALYSCNAWLTRNIDRLLGGIAFKIPILSMLRKASGLKVAKVEPTLVRRDFLEGIKIFLAEFTRNYPRAAEQLRESFSANDEEMRRQALQLLADAQPGAVPAALLARQLGLGEPELAKLLDRMNELTDRIKGKDVKLAFSQLAAVLRARILLLNEIPGGLET